MVEPGLVITWWSQTWHSLLQYPLLGARKSCIQVCTWFAHGLHGTSGTVRCLPLGDDSGLHRAIIDPAKGLSNKRVARKRVSSYLDLFECMEMRVIGVCQSRLGGSNLFSQGRKPIAVTVVVTAMQRMSRPVSSLRPPPDIALECIC